MLEETAVDFSPCLVSIHTGVAMADGTLINVAPEAVRVMTTGAMLWPQAVNLQPALLFVSPMGANVQVKKAQGERGEGGGGAVKCDTRSHPPSFFLQPQGVQIAPYLMAVSPMGANVAPAGAVVGEPDEGKGVGEGVFWGGGCGHQLSPLFARSPRRQDGHARWQTN